MNDEHDTSSSTHRTLSGQEANEVLEGYDRASTERIYESARHTIDAEMHRLLALGVIEVEHTRAEIAGNPKDFATEVLVIELRAIAGQQVQIGTTNKLRTHFDKISGELRRRGLDNNGERLDG